MSYFAQVVPYLAYAVMTAVKELPGPYELEGSLLAVLQFVFTFGIVIGKFKILRLISAILSAGFGTAAFIVYYINQTSVGNPLSLGPLVIFGSGLFYGTAIAVIMILAMIKQRKLKKATEEAAASAPPVKRRFDD